MFAYEQEVRIVLVHDFPNSVSKNRKTIGMYLDWDPELHLEKIWVHPEAHPWFMETVTETVQRLAPKLSNNGSPSVYWSQMNISPPF